MLRRLFTLASLSSLLLFTPGCLWFLIGGLGTTAYYVTKEEEQPQNPPAVITTAPARMIQNPAQVTYTLFDAESDLCSIQVEYKVGTGSFHPAVEGSGGDGMLDLAASPEGVPHTFHWDFSSGPDLVSPETLDVTIRVTAADATARYGSGESAGHSLGNAQPAVQSVTVPAGDVAGTVTLEYVVGDTHSDTAWIEVQFKRESDGADWALFGHAASPDASDPTFVTQNRATSPTGVTHVFPWDSDAASDLQGEDADVRVRVRASDDMGATWGSWMESPGVVSVRNDTAPRIEISPVNASQNGLVRIPYKAIDPEGHTVSLVAEFQVMGSVVWMPATAGPGTTPLRLTASASGTEGHFAWDSARDGVSQKSVTFRLAPSEASITGIPGTANFAIGNAGGDAWFAKATLLNPRQKIGVAVVNGILYAVGGYASGYSDKVEAYDPRTDTWTTKTPMPYPTMSHGCASVGGRIYAVGGSSSLGMNVATTLEYDPEADTWAQKADKPTPRRGVACVALGGKIYTLGGSDQFGTRYNEVQEYDPGSDTWRNMQPMQQIRAYFSASVAGGRIYAFGGFSLNPTVEAFDPYTGALGTWTYRANLPLARHETASATVGGKVYLFGGYNSGFLARTEQYDPGANAWSLMSDMLEARRFAGAATLGGKIFVVGGEGAEARNDEYVPPMEAWTSLANMPTARFDLAMATLGNRVYATGGYNGGARTEVEAFDLTTASWVSRAPLNYARRWHRVAAANGKLYAIGGYNSNYVAPVEEYDPVANAWTPLGNMPVPRTRPGCAVAGGKIYVLGGWSGATLQRCDEFDPVAVAWTQKTDMPTPRNRLSATTVGDLIFAVGGAGSSPFLRDEVEVYDPTADTWSARTPMPTPRYNVQCAAVGRKIYALGGYDGGVSAAVEVYDSAKDAWTALANMPNPRSDLAACSAGDKVFVGGGISGSTALADFQALAVAMLSLVVKHDDLPASLSGAVLFGGGGRLFLAGGEASGGATEATQEIDLPTDVPASETTPFSVDPFWSGAPASPAAFHGAASVSFGNAGYRSGGFDSAGASTADLLRWDPATEAWTPLASMPAARAGHGAAVVVSLLYVFGGVTAGGTKSNSVDVYDFTSGVWNTGTVFDTMSTARSHFGCAALGGLIYVFGGEGAGGTPMSSVERYDPTADSWTALADLPFALEGSLCLIEGGSLRLFGGELTSGAMTDLIFVYDVDADAWNVNSATTPYPARDLCGCTVVHSWDHRGTTRTDEFCFLAGGFDGTNFRDGFFRFYTR